VITLRVPPLRERREDVPLLVARFVQRFARETNRDVDAVSEDALKILVEYDWPGNIRELENVVERAVVTSKKRVIPAEAFAYLTGRDVCALAVSGTLSLEQVEIEHIRRILDAEEWNVSRAAKILELDRTTLHKKIRKYNLKGGEA
jgi:DNA-binding NtrC family response regulator